MSRQGVKIEIISKKNPIPRRSIQIDRNAIKVHDGSFHKEEPDFHQTPRQPIGNTPKANSGPAEKYSSPYVSARNPKQPNSNLHLPPLPSPGGGMKKSASSNLHSHSNFSQKAEQVMVEHFLQHIGESSKVKAHDKLSNSAGSHDQQLASSMKDVSAFNAKEGKRGSANLLPIDLERDLHTSLVDDLPEKEKTPRLILNKGSQELNHAQHHQHHNSTPAQTPMSGPLPRRKISYESVRYGFKHEIMSMDGYSPDYEKENQDFSKFYQFTTNKETTRLFLLADGHGPIGHTASLTAIELIIAFIEKKITEKTELELTDECLKQVLIDAFDHVQSKFLADKENNYKYSGTTMVVFMVRRITLFLASAGDSKGFLASKCGTQIVPSMISKDHKPDNPEESERIAKSGGVVAPYFDADNKPNGPQRVWNKAQTEPGLATSRTLGDLCGHNLGVIHTPGKSI